MLPLPLLMKSVQGYYHSASWSSSWGPEPPYWYNAATGDFTTNYGASGTAYNLTPVQINYSTLQNGLKTARITGGPNGEESWGLRGISATVSGIYASQTTHFIVLKQQSTGINSVEFDYIYDPGETAINVGVDGTGPCGGYNISKVFFRSQVSGNDGFARKGLVSQSWDWDPYYVGGLPGSMYWSACEKEIHYLLRELQTYTYSKFQVVSGTFSGVSNTGLTARVNSATESSAKVNDNNCYNCSDDMPHNVSSPNQLRISNYSNSQPNANLIAEYIQYNTMLTNSQIISIENYLKSKWSIT